MYGGGLDVHASLLKIYPEIVNVCKCLPPPRSVLVTYTAFLANYKTPKSHPTLHAPPGIRRGLGEEPAIHRD